MLSLIIDCGLLWNKATRITPFRYLKSKRLLQMYEKLGTYRAIVGFNETYSV